GRANSKKRTIYGRAARSPYSLLTLFDYPDPNITSEQREVTNVPLQGLFFMNSDLIQREADALLARLGPEGEPEARIQRAYKILYQREASPKEVERGMAFLKKADELFKAAAAEPQKAQTGGGAGADFRRRRHRRRPGGQSLDAETPSFSRQGEARYRRLPAGWLEPDRLVRLQADARQVRRQAPALRDAAHRIRDRQPDEVAVQVPEIRAE